MGKAVGLAACAPNPNEVVVPNAGAGASVGGGTAAADTAAANDGVAAPNANDDAVLAGAGAPNPPRFPPSVGTLPVAGAAPENISNRNWKLQREKRLHEISMHCASVCSLPKLGNDPAPNVGGAADMVETWGTAPTAAADGAAGVPNENALAVGGA